MCACHQKQILEGKNDKWKNLEAEANLDIQTVINIIKGNLGEYLALT